MANRLVKRVMVHLSWLYMIQRAGEPATEDTYRGGPKKLDSFFRVFKCTVASDHAALGSGFRL